MRSQQFAKREAVDARHLEIKRNQIAAYALQHTKGGAGFGGGHDTILRSLEDFTQPFTRGGIIVTVGAHAGEVVLDLGRLPSEAGRCDAVMAHWRLVTPALLEAVRGAGGELYVWTVDDADRIRALEALGVDGVITNDPRLFD